MFHVKQWGGLVYYCLIRVCDYLKHSNKLFKHYFLQKVQEPYNLKLYGSCGGFR